MEGNNTSKKRDDDNRFLERVRKQQYFERRKSEPNIRIPDLNNDNYIEIKETNKKRNPKEKAEKSELIPKQS
jgi:hypothetical protein